MKNNQLHRILEQLEDRVLFDAVPDGGFLLQADQPMDAPVQSQQMVEEVAPLHEEAAQPRELILIDANIQDADQLLSEILESRGDRLFEVRMIDANSDGLSQVSNILDSNDVQYDAVHILSHGNESGMQLGSSWINSNSLESYAGQLAGWSDSLTSEADLLIYGCDLAASQSGQEMLEMMSVMSGADVAASTDLTGNEDLGGDWDLEHEVGVINTANLSVTKYFGTLNSTFTIQPTTQPTVAGSGGVGTTGTWTNAGFVDTDDLVDADGDGDFTNDQDVMVDLVATVIDVTGTASVDFETVSTTNPLQDDMRARVSGDGTATVQWEVFLAGTNIKPAAGEIGLTISDIDGSGGNPETVEGISADLGNLSSYTLQSPTNLETSIENNNLIAQGTENQNSEEPSWVRFEWATANSLVLTYYVYDNGTRFFNHDGDGDLVFTNPNTFFTQGIDLDTDDSSGATGSNYQTTYVDGSISGTDQDVPVSVADADIQIFDLNDTTLQGATITLTNASAGDQLNIDSALMTSLGITANLDTTTVPGQIIVTLSGEALIDNYETAIQSVTYSNNNATFDQSYVRTVEISATDGTNSTGTAITTIDFATAIQSPTAASDFYVLDEDASITIDSSNGLLTNDEDPQGDGLTITTARDSSGALITIGSPHVMPSGGTLTLNDDGSFTYVPAANFSGAEFINYTIEDSAGNTGSTFASIVVNPVADVPTQVLSYTSATINEDSLSIPLSITSSTPDNDGSEQLIVEIENIPIGATITDGANTFISSAMAMSVDVSTWDLTQIQFQAALHSDVDQSITVRTTTVEPNGDSQTVSEVVNYTVDAVADAPNVALTNASAAVDQPINLTNLIAVSLVDTDGSETLTSITIANIPPGAQILENGTPITITGGSVTLTPAQLANTLTFQPPAGGVATYSLDVTATSTETSAENGVATLTATSAVQQLDLTFDNVDDPVDAHDDVIVLGSGQTTTFNVIGNDEILDGGPVITTVDGQAIAVGGSVALASGDGTVTLNADGTLTYSASPTASGTIQFDYTVQDSDNDVDTATVFASITPPLVNDSDSTNEDTTVNINVLGNDEANLAILPATITSQTATNGSNGTTSVQPDGTIDYTPNANFNGSDSFDYTVTGLASGLQYQFFDGDGSERSLDDFPDVDPDFVGLVQDLDSVALSNALTASNQNYFVQYSGLVYVDNAGAYEFSLNSNNGSRIYIDGVLVADNNNAGGTTSNVGSVNLTSGYHDIVIEHYDFGGAATLMARMSGPDTSGVATDLLSTGQVGSALVTQSATVDVTINPVNDDPDAIGSIPNQTSNDAQTIATLDITSYFDDVDGDALTYSAGSTLPPGLSLDPNTGLITGTIDADASLSGPYSVTITASDGNGGTDASQTFTWNVNNPAPTAQDDDLGTNEGVSISGNVMADNGNGIDSDPDGDTLTVTEVNGSPTNVGATIAGDNGGNFTIQSDGTYSFDPAGQFNNLSAGQTTTSSVTYLVSDGQGGTSTATVTVTVTGINDLPVTVGSIPTQNNNDSQTIADLDITGYFNDPDTNDTLTYSAGATLPPGLTLDPNTGVISGTLDADASTGGPYTVVITADDGNGGTVQQSFTWNANNPAPTATDDNFTTTENATSSGNVITANNGNGVDNDPDGDALVVSQVDGNIANVGVAIAGSNGGQFTINTDGSYLFDPGTDFDNLAVSETIMTAVTYTISDGEGGTSTATVTVTVQGQNDTPLQNGTVPTQNNNDSDSPTLNVSSFFNDPDGSDSLTFSDGGSLPPGLTIDPNTGVISGTIDSSASQSGPFAVVITADDGNGGTVQQSFTWNVSNPTPTAVNDTDTTDQNTVLSGGDVLSNDSDPDGDVLNVSLVNGAAGNVGSATAGSAGGLFIVNSDGTYSFDPNGEFDGLTIGESINTQITYQMTDADGATSAATVIITVQGTNDDPTTVGTIADQSNADSDTITAVDTSAFFSDPDLSDTLQYSVSGLPAGLSIDINTGLITGTVDSSASQGGVGGVYSVQVTATDDQGQFVSQSFDWTVTNPPPVAADDVDSTNEDTALSGDVSGNDSDPDGDAVSYNKLTDPTNGSLVFNSGDGTFLYTPDADFHGTDTFTYEIVDADGATNSATVTITVDPVNDAPVVDAAIPDQSNDDSDVVSVDVSSNFSDVDGDTLTFSASGLPIGLTIDVNTGVISGTIDSSASVSGPYTVVVTADDGNGESVSDTFTWNVANPGPIAINDNYSTNEDTLLSGDVSTNDSDPDSDALTFAQTSSPTNGTLSFNSDGSFTYDPDPDYVGSDSFTYQVTDADGSTSTATVDITVDPINDLPVVDTIIADQSNNDSDVVSVDVSGNFSDVDGDTLTFTATGLPPGLSIDLNTGVISGTIDSSASTGGPYTVTVTANDGNGGTVDDTFTWSVANPGPVATGDGYTTNEDSAVSGDVSTNDSDPDGDALTFTQTSSPTNGSLVFNTDGSFTYNPDPNFNGTDSFTYEVTDADGATSSATVMITVDPVNDGPVVDSPIADQSNNDSDVVSVNVSGNFSDVDGDTLTYSATNLPPGLTIDVNTGIISGTIDSSASTGGPYTVMITADDGNGGSVTDTLTWNVANPAPIANVDNYTTNEDTAVSGDVSTNDSDADGDMLTFTQTSSPTNGSLTFNNDGSFTYDPNPNFNGSDSFTYQVTDADGSTATATVNITVDPVNDGPVVDSPIADQSNNDSDAISVDVSSNFSDVDGDTLTFSASNLPAGLSIDVNTGIISGTIDSSASTGGPYTVMITADDGNGGSVTDTFTWNVANPAPIAMDDSFSINEDTLLSGDVSTNDSDPDGDTLSYNQLTNPTNGSVTFNSDGTFDYNPNPGYFGTDSFTYEAIDADGNATSATVNINIGSVNDLPVVDSPIADQSNNDSDVVSVDVSGNFSDPDGDTLTFSATGLPPGLTIDTNTGVISGTIDSSASTGGPYTVMITADDGNGGTVTDTLTWNVANPGPIATGDGYSTNEDTAVSGDVSSNDSDPDGDALTFTQTSSPTNGSLTFNNDGSFTYNPNPNFNGTDSFTYEVTDADGATSSATVMITVDPVNDGPVVDSPIADQSNNDSDVVSVDVSSNFSDVDGDTLTYSATGLPPGLTIDVNTGVISGTIDSSASTGGPYTVMITADDGNGGSVTDTFTWNVANPAPIAVTDNFSTNEDTLLSGDVSTNDSDPDGDTLSFNQLTSPTNGTLTFNSDGTFDYNPNPGYFGNDSFTYEAVDADGNAISATVNISIGSVNDLPVVDSPIADQSNNDSDVVSVDVSGNFSDPDGDTLTYSATNLPPGLTIDTNTGVISGTIDSSASTGGPYTVMITADDGNGGTVTDTLTWNVANPGPVATGDNYSTNEDTAVSGDVSTNDSDPDGDALTFAQTTSPANGVLSFNSDGSFTYTPNPDFNGTDSFTYEVTDADGSTSSATVMLTVDPVNDTPVVDSPIADQSNLDSDAVTVDVSSNFSDPDGDSLSFSATGLPPGLTIDTNTGVISGTIDSSASTGGPYNVTVTTDDGNGGMNSDTFVWNVVNVDPVAGDDSFSTNEDTTYSGTVTANDNDPDGDSVTYSALTTPANGTLTFNNDGTFDYTPNTNFNGSDSFIYEMMDADGATTTAMVTIVVDAVNDLPIVAAPIADQADSDSDVVSVDVSSNFSDPDGNTLTFSATNLPPGLTIDTNTGVISGTIDSSASTGGPYTVTVTADDGNGGMVTDSFNWAVTNPGPVAIDDSLSTNEDTSVNGVAGANDADPDGDALTFNQLTSPANGSVVFNNDGTFTYTPDPDFNGMDSFDYEVVDADGATSTGRVTITIAAVNDAPVVDTMIADQTNDDSDVVSVDVSSNFSDLEGDTLTFSAANLPPGLSIDPNTGIISGTIDSSASTGGPYSVTVTVDDGNGGSVSDTFDWNVNNPGPVSNDDVFSVNEDNPVSDTVTSNDSDPDGDALTYAQLSSPSNGTLSFNSDGTFTYTPNPDFNGIDTFSYQATDADGASSTSTVTINVGAINDPPVVSSPIADQANLDSDAVSIDVSGNFSDVDGDTLTYSATGLPSGLSLDPISGVISGTIDSSASTGGPYTVMITADDGNLGTVTDTFTWNVTNPGPNATNDGVSTTEDTSVNGDVSTNDSDPDSDTLTYSQLTSPANGTVTFNTDGTFTYMPNLNFTGIDTFDYQVTDADGASSTATVTISVGNVNDPPVVTAPIADQTNNDADPVSVDISGNFNDVEGDTLTYSATGLPPGLTLDPNTGIISGTIDSDASLSGPFTVVVTADDGNGGMVDDTFNWNVNNPGPSATDNANSVTEDTTLTSSGNVILDNDGSGVDSDPDSDALTVLQVDGQPAGVTVNGLYGTLQVNSDGTYTYNLTNSDSSVQALDVGETLIDTFTYTVTDSQGGTSDATLTITINGTNDAPIPSAIPNQADQDTDVVGGLDMSTYFSDVDDTALAYSVTGLPAGLSIDPVTGIISGTIDGNASTGGPASDGVYTVFVTAQDDDGEFAVSSFTWTVGNPGPVADDDNFSTNEDTSFSDSVASNDSDPDGDTLTYAVVSGPSNGTLTFNTDGSFSFDPNADYFGNDSFVYQVTDADGATDTATVNITVDSVNDLPTATPISDQNDLDSSVISLDVSGNFSDVETVSLSFAATGLPGGLTIDPVSGVISGTIDSSASQTGPYTVVVWATDADGSSVSDTFVWTVTNPGPSAIDDSFSTLEDTAFSDTVATNDSDPDGDALTYNLVSSTSNGTLTLNPDGTFNYNPNAGYNGLDTFQYEVMDADGATSTATAYINIGAVNDVPVVDTPITDQSNIDSDTVSIDVGSGFSDPDGDTLTFSAANLPPGLSIDPVTGIVSGTIDSSASTGGPYNVVVTANDGNGGVVSDTFVWSVNNVGPTAIDDVVSGNEDTIISGDVSGNDSDPDGDSLTYALFSPPTNGSVVVNSDGSFDYTPNPDFNGTDTFQYEVTDADGAVALATVTVTVDPVNDAPVGTPISNINSFDSDPVSVDVSGSFNDVDGDTLTYSTTGLPPGLSIDPVTGIIGGTIDSSASTGGPYSVTVTVDDGNGGTTNETFTWNVTNPGPIAVDDNRVINEDSTLNSTVASNDSDPDGDALTFSVTSPPSNGSVAMNPDGTFSYTPNTNFNGTDTFNYEVVDADGQVSSALVTINVTAGNDAPTVVTPIGTQSSDDSDPVSVDVSGSFDDAENDPLTFTATGLPPGLTIDPISGVISGIVDSSASTGGPYTVSITADDGNGGFVTDTFTWNIANPAPNAVDDLESVVEDNALTSTVATNDSDPDGDTLNFSVASGPANGTVVMNPDGSYTYTPDPGFYGTDTFQYNAIDADGSVTTATVTINVIEDPQPTDANDDNATTSQDEVVVVNLVGNDVDPDGLLFNVVSIDGQPVTPGQSVTLSSGAIVTLNGDGTATYDPNGVYDELSHDESTSDLFTYTVENERGLQDTAIARVTIDGAGGFAFDSFNNFATEHREEKTHGFGRQVLLSHQIDNLAKEPIIAGYAKPGTILVARLYAPDGSVISEVHSQADLAGNFVINFRNTEVVRNARVVVEQIATETAPLGEGIISLTEDTYRSLQLDAQQKEAHTIGSILADAPEQSLEDLQKFNRNPLNLL